jgi:uncharacterized protein DUF4265
MQKAKVRIPINEGSISGETLWAEKVGDNLFRLCNIPFIANGYAEGDIVLCQQKNGFDEVISIKEDSGNGTIRLIFTNPHGNEAQQILKELESVGCTYEFSSSKLVGVTIPCELEVPFSQLSNFLNTSDNKILSGWEVAKEIIRSN